MNQHFDTHFQRQIITIQPGEYYSSNEDIFIATVLGSCISIALFDTELKLGGLNHFMLPSSTRKDEPAQSDQGRFGDYAVELLLNDLYKKGAKKSRLKAKVFGGGNVLESPGNMTGLNNINFALHFLEEEHIPVLGNDVGGIFPRKIYVNPVTQKVYLKRIQREGLSMEQIKQREAKYAQTLKTMQEKIGTITWF
ncbi:MAG: hypothetical protein NC041_06740 [Bacteroides sp.]|nr:hypothetical protein [Prevotella sp.]MCM1406993.1 hypothetical protein [Treponema brennaborense]MCM1470144.1 hypothetical protein [Bacteroides sp.]